MSEQSDFDKLMDHEYDGIREYDNPLPSWWTTVFIATVVFSVFYWLYYQGGGPGISEAEEYTLAQAQLAEVQAQEAAAAGSVDEQILAKLMSSPEALKPAKAVFIKNCKACHGEHGQGDVVGPNLTDSHQIHGITRLDIYQTIRNGVVEKGMQAWAKLLSPQELLSVAAYVASLRGTDVAGGRAPQGEPVAAFE